MKKIILGRHAIAENNPETGNDFDRQLTTQGVAIAKLQAKRMMDDEIFADQLISSDAKRAIQTAEIYANTLGIKNIQLQHFLYEDFTTQDFINFISKLPQKVNSVMIIGHNPTIASLAGRFIPNFYSAVQPAALMVIDFDCKNWRDIAVNTGKLAAVFVP